MYLHTSWDALLKEKKAVRPGFFSNKRRQSTFPFGAAEGARTMQCEQVMSL